MISSRSRILYLATTLVGLVGLALSATPASATTSNYISSKLSVSVATGNVVTAKVTIKTRAGSATVVQAGVCFLNDELFTQPFPLAQNVRLTTTGGTFVKSAYVPPGRYHVRGCVQEKARNWPAVDGPVLAVTVGTLTTGTPPATSTSPVFSGAVAPPCSTDFC